MIYEWIYKHPAETQQKFKVRSKVADGFRCRWSLKNTPLMPLCISTNNRHLNRQRRTKSKIFINERSSTCLKFFCLFPISSLINKHIKFNGSQINSVCVTAMCELISSVFITHRAHEPALASTPWPDVIRVQHGTWHFGFKWYLESKIDGVLVFWRLRNPSKVKYILSFVYCGVIMETSFTAPTHCCSSVAHFASFVSPYFVSPFG